MRSNFYDKYSKLPQQWLNGQCPQPPQFEDTVGHPRTCPPFASIFMVKESTRIMGVMPPSGHCVRSPSPPRGLMSSNHNKAPGGPSSYPRKGINSLREDTMSPTYLTAVRPPNLASGSMPPYGPGSDSPRGLPSPDLSNSARSLGLRTSTAYESELAHALDERPRFALSEGPQTASHLPGSSDAAGGPSRPASTSPGKHVPRRASRPRIYSCSMCDKTFDRPSALETHSHAHTGEQPFVCPVPGCERRFSVQSNARRHALIHEKSRERTVHIEFEEPVVASTSPLAVTPPAILEWTGGK